MVKTQGYVCFGNSTMMGDPLDITNVTPTGSVWKWVPYGAGCVVYTNTYIGLERGKLRVIACVTWA